jgi:hypothetical protein
MDLEESYETVPQSAALPKELEVSIVERKDTTLTMEELLAKCSAFEKTNEELREILKIQKEQMVENAIEKKILEGKIKENTEKLQKQEQIILDLKNLQLPKIALPLPNARFILEPEPILLLPPEPTDEEIRALDPSIQASAQLLREIFENMIKNEPEMIQNFLTEYLGIDDKSESTQILGLETCAVFSYFVDHLLQAPPGTRGDRWLLKFIMPQVFLNYCQVAHVFNLTSQARQFKPNPDFKDDIFVKEWVLNGLVLQMAGLQEYLPILLHLVRTNPLFTSLNKEKRRKEVNKRLVNFFKVMNCTWPNVRANQQTW